MIIRDDVNGVAVMRMAHGKVSALDVEFCRRIVDEVTHIGSSDARALVLTGSNSTFSAGVDLFRVLNGGTAYLRSFLPAMESLFRTLLTFPKPVVSAVNGHAIAGGCIIAATSDYRVMVEGKARIGVPELMVGVPFPTLPFEIVAARVSPVHFRQLVFGGRTMEAHDAVAVGFVDETAPPDVLLSRALDAARRLAAIPPVTFSLTKRAFVDRILERLEKSRSLNDEVLDAWSSAEVQARVRAYLEETVGKK
jgi:enoyl-CoA hydratase